MSIVSTSCIGPGLIPFFQQSKNTSSTGEPSLITVFITPVGIGVNAAVPGAADTNVFQSNPNHNISISFSFRDGGAQKNKKGAFDLELKWIERDRVYCKGWTGRTKDGNICSQTRWGRRDRKNNIYNTLWYILYVYYGGRTNRVARHGDQGGFVIASCCGVLLERANRFLFNTTRMRTGSSDKGMAVV